MPDNDTDKSRGHVEVLRIFLKEASLTVADTPEVFRKTWKPKARLDINTNIRTLENSTYEVALRLHLETQNENDAPGYTVKLNQAGIFRLTGVGDEHNERVLSTYCANILFPYARETIDSLTVKASFPPVMLAPINFEALRQEVEKHQATVTIGDPEIRH